MFWDKRSKLRQASPAAAEASPHPDKMEVDHIYSPSTGGNFDRYTSSLSRHSFSSIGGNYPSRGWGHRTMTTTTTTSPCWWLDFETDAIESRAQEYNRATKQFVGSWTQHYHFEPRLNATPDGDWLRQGQHLKTEPAYQAFFEKTRAKLSPSRGGANSPIKASVTASPAKYKIPALLPNNKNQPQRRSILQPGRDILAPLMMKHGEMSPAFKKQK